jgi:hypothetical protein
MTDGADSSLGQQLLNHPLRDFVLAFAELMMPNTPLRINEIEGRPIFVFESAPYSKIAVDRDGIIDPYVFVA